MNNAEIVFVCFMTLLLFIPFCMSIFLRKDSRRKGINTRHPYPQPIPKPSTPPPPLRKRFTINVQIVTADHVDEIAEKVNHELNDGWSLNGGLFNLDGKICQSLTRHVPH